MGKNHDEVVRRQQAGEAEHRGEYEKMFDRIVGHLADHADAIDNQNLPPTEEKGKQDDKKK